MCLSSITLFLLKATSTSLFNTLPNKNMSSITRDPEWENAWSNLKHSLVVSRIEVGKVFFYERSIVARTLEDLKDLEAMKDPKNEKYHARIVFGNKSPGKIYDVEKYPAKTQFYLGSQTLGLAYILAEGLIDTLGIPRDALYSFLEIDPQPHPEILSQEQGIGLPDWQKLFWLKIPPTLKAPMIESFKRSQQDIVIGRSKFTPTYLALEEGQASTSKVLALPAPLPPVPNPTKDSTVVTEKKNDETDTDASQKRKNYTPKKKETPTKADAGLKDSRVKKAVKAKPKPRKKQVVDDDSDEVEEAVLKKKSKPTPKVKGKLEIKHVVEDDDEDEEDESTKTAVIKGYKRSAKTRKSIADNPFIIYETEAGGSDEVDADDEDFIDDGEEEEERDESNEDDDDDDDIQEIPLPSKWKTLLDGGAKGGKKVTGKKPQQ